MPQHRFILQPYRGLPSRFQCPQCQHRLKTFTRYIDTETGNHLADHVGLCDREEKCGYHYTPRQYFAESTYHVNTRPVRSLRTAPAKSVFSTLNFGLVKETMREKNYIHNNFVAYLATHFGWAIAVQAAEKYNIGTARRWLGACVFWQMDTQRRIRTGKVMLYNRVTGKRVKQPFNHIAWAHGIIGTPDFKLQQCLFGEMLLYANPEATVFITESEKTAVIASLKFPQYVWLAAGSRNGLDADKCQVLAGRKVYLVPDVGCFAEWLEKARELNLRIPTATFFVHDELEREATDEERKQGIDWVDRWLNKQPASSTK
jgi:hypothetical protein